MKKVLFVATVVKKHIRVFHLPFLKKLKEQGFSVHVAARNDFASEPCEISYCDCYFDLPFERSPFHFSNFRVYCQLKHLIETEQYDIIHCHTPIAAALTRLICRNIRKNGTKVIYTAHGFHFYKGAPLINWLLYYPIEKLCSRWTDVLITINQEDYVLAKRKMHADAVEYIPGVGIDVKKFADVTIDRNHIRKSLGVQENAFLLLSVGEVIKNKNHETVIRALAMLKEHPISYVIVGEGKLQPYLEMLAKKLGVSEKVHFLGYQYEVSHLYKAADLFLHPSFREGRPVALMEAMASGLPTVCSRVRGNADLIGDEGGSLCAVTAVTEYRDAILLHMRDEALCQKEAKRNRNMAKQCEKTMIDDMVMNIYRRFL